MASLTVSAERAQQIRAESHSWLSYDLSRSQLCDLELLMTGAYSPLKGYLTQAESRSVERAYRLPDGTFWPFPIVLGVPEKFAGLKPGTTVALRDPEGVLLAALHVEDVWRPDPDAKGTGESSPALQHPLCVGGRVEGIQAPVHYDFVQDRHTPSALRRMLASLVSDRAFAYQTEEVLYRSDQDLITRTCEELGAAAVLQPLVPSLAPGDPEPYMRMRCVRKAVQAWTGAKPIVSVLPMLRQARGDRGRLLQAIVARNYGCGHYLIAAQDIEAPEREEEHLNGLLEGAGVSILVRRHSWAPGGKRATTDDVRRLLSEGGDLPLEWTSPEVAQELRRYYVPRHQGGLTLFFTGLSGSGKSTTANVVLTKLLERGGRPVTLLDGDIVRKNLSSELGFSKEHRDLNIRRIGYVASEITKHGGIAICCPIAPYDSIRREVRSLIERVGGFVLIHMSTPIEVCESRDRKGLYAKARSGHLQGFTGVSDPYEPPADAEIVLDSSASTPEESARILLTYLERRGYLPSTGPE